ncbi:SWI/SNF complex protein [Teratosphaeria nubilosa]|uniref:SWI/SNF complex protein n=1 Tax=Teratosphaeria nubilosa TaxID=161662 RepID=A0A6G1L4H2_9PEZI|nr:SWI/SNF complex protein [Teratosphaeria nubilosa]
MQNYRGFQQQRSPAASRRGPGPMVPGPQHGQQPAMTPQQIQAQRLEDMRRLDAARRISKKPTDREIPFELSDVVVGDGVQRYGKLRDTERQLDAVMMRKRLDISDNLQRRYARREGVLRVWVSNTAEGQPWQEGSGISEDGTFEFGENSQATFRVKIEGRFLDDPSEEKAEEEKKEGELEDSKGADAKRPSQRPRFSQFFKAIRMNFSRNPSLQPDGYSEIEWRKPQPGQQNPNYDPNSSEALFDTLEFERKTDENINITVNLYRDDRHERFQLSPQLAEILDTDEDDRAGAVQGIWEYCRAMKLQDAEDKRWIQCDDQLKKLFNQERIHFPYVPDLLHPHLKPLPPIQLSYTIRVDKSYIRGDPEKGIQPSAPTIYDIRIPLPNPLMGQLTRFHTSKAHLGTLQQIVKTDDDLALLVQKINQTNAKRKFYDNLAKDPTNFLKRWISSQQRDLEVILAEATRGGGEDASGEEWRKGGQDGVWGSRLAQESVGLYLARNTKPY